MTDENAPAISVAVSTHDRAETIPNLVTALENQTLPRHLFEVVVVDDGSSDQTYEVLTELARTSPLDLRVIRSDTKRGPAAGRNIAWRACRGDIIAFTDDDCQPAPDWLERAMEAMQAGGEILVGRTVPNPDQSEHSGPFSRTMIVNDAKYLATCNVLYRRIDLEKVGGFDEGFPTPGGEDTDLGWRIREKLGRKIEFAGQALVYHDIRPSRFVDQVRTTVRWVGIPRLVKKHPKQMRDQLYMRVFWRSSHPYVIAATAGGIAALALLHPLPLLLGLPWLYLRVKKQPLTWGRVRRFVVLPGAFAIDLLEVFVMIGASIRFRTFVL